MMTFNLKCRNGNYLSTHKPKNVGSSNCWDDKCRALNLTIEQAQELVNSQGLAKYLDIVISSSATPLTDAEFEHESFCIKNRCHWYDYKPDHIVDANKKVCEWKHDGKWGTPECDPSESYTRTLTNCPKCGKPIKEVE